MKRSYAVILTAILLAGIAAGCGGTTQPTATPSPTLPPTASPTETVSPTMRTERPETTEQVFRVEGLDETVETELYVSPLLYSMYVDTSRYQAEYSDGADRITPSGQSVANVSMEVRYLAGADAQTLEPKYMNDYPEYTDISYLGEIEIGDSGLMATAISASTGDKADSLVMQAYLINDGDGVFVLKITCPAEAQEGHGSRLGQMLETFLPFSH
ncbi:hypothetical protein [Papillibacter cinnamivorans]|uniref:Lipoprotein LpqN n=1 Tax=Papillibacter cinnamivorans DSM 12816 TaxID=1122930 RepID=A0A1W2BV75_9FIRM|nr:hypothetical protein [Papillibacter cinnamivorans]SMC76512.1 hypothetical protein SAMN02745168_2386 [Papillibacter cinnamivorans DSM 12816]